MWGGCGDCQFVYLICKLFHDLFLNMLQRLWDWFVSFFYETDTRTHTIRPVTTFPMVNFWEPTESLTEDCPLHQFTSPRNPNETRVL